MITIVLLMLRHRWRRAVTICALATFIYGVAVAVPAYLVAADRAMIANEIRHASTAELSVSAQQSIDVSTGRDRTFETSAPQRLAQPWLTTTFAVSINVDTSDTDPDAAVPQMVYRQDYCAHVALVAGRCPLTAREVLVSPDLAALLHVSAGGQAPLWWAYLSPNGWVASPAQITVSVVGIYRPADPSDTYWGDNAYFSNGRMAPILAERGTIDALAHGGESQTVDATLRPGAITDATIARTRAWVASTTTLGDNVQVSTQIPATLARIEADRQTIREVLPDSAVALILIGCLVLFLAAAQAVGDRTGELGVIRLRGVWTPDRWWLGAGESVLPVLAGIPLGLIAGGALASGVVAATIGSGSDAVATGGLFGLATITAMLIAVLAAHIRPLAAPVADLLRRIPARMRGWRAATAQTLIASLAAVAVAQLYLQPGPLTGIMLIAPVLIVVALGLLAGPVILPLAGSLGRRALAGPGRLGLGLGAISLARRPGAHLLLAVQVIALGMAGFAAADATTARHARSEWVTLSLGSPRVIDAGTVHPADLLHAVRTADPSGRYAMAVVDLPARDSAEPATIAVDAPRLPAVATWPAQTAVSAATVAAELHPALPVASTITGTAIAVTMNTTSFTTDLDGYDHPGTGRIGVFAAFTPADGSTPVSVDLGDLRPGRATLTADVPACAGGCHFVGLTLESRTGSGMQLDTYVSGMTVDGHPADLPWTDGSRWRMSGTADSELQPGLSTSPDGLEITAPEYATITGGLGATLIDAPTALPVVTAATTGATSIGDTEGDPIKTHVDGGPVGALPGVGTRGTLVDLEYLIRAESATASAATTASTTAHGEIWLAAGTPPSIVTALTAAGVVTIADRTSASELSYLDHQGPALGIGFEIAAAASAVLVATICIVLMAGIDRGGRVAELRTLRVQGLPRSAMRRAATASHVGPVALALVAGCAVAAGAWWLTGRRLPIFTTGDHADLPSSAAPWWALIIATVAGAAALTIGAAIAARSLSRRVP